MSVVHRLTAIFAFVATLFASSAYAAEWSTSQLVTGVQVTASSGGSATFYVLSSGWGSASCPTAQWAYIDSSATGASEILALAMQAKQQGKYVQIYGTCSSGYFIITALYVLS